MTVGRFVPAVRPYETTSPARPPPCAQSPHARVQRPDPERPHGFQPAQSPLRAAGVARGDTLGFGGRRVPAGSAGRTRAPRAETPELAGRAAVRIPRRYAVAAVCLWPQRGVSARPPRQRAAVEIPDRAPR